MSWVALWSQPFALTLAAELSVAVPLLGSLRSVPHRMAAVAAAQLASHPIVWFVLPGLGLGRAPFLLLAEGWAVGLDLLLYRLIYAQLSWARALAVSALANGASLALGTALL